MDEAVAGQNGRKEPKIDIARRAALDIVEQFAAYARAHQDEPVLLGMYEFSRRRGEPDCRTVVAMGPPDREGAARAIAGLDADGRRVLFTLLGQLKQSVLEGAGRKTPEAAA